MILAQFWHNLFMRTLYSIHWFCVFHISKLTNTYSYSINAPLIIIFILFLSCLLIIVQHMLRNGRTGHTWHLVVDHIMLVMKMRSSSPVNRLVGLYRGFMCMYKKQKHKKKKKDKKKKKKRGLVTAGCLQQLEKAGCK